MIAYLREQFQAFKAWRQRRFDESILRDLRVKRDWSVHHWVESSKTGG